MYIYMIWLFLSGVLSGGIVMYLGAKRFGLFGTILPFDTTDGNEELLEEAQEAVQARIEKRKSRIIAVVKAEGKITNDGVEDLYCISDRTASRYLKDLVADGKLSRQGTGRSVYYTLPETANPAK